MGNKIKVSKKKRREIEKFLDLRFTYLKELRDPIDTEILKEIEMFNNVDSEIRDKEEWEEKYETPYIYTIIQTIVARIQSTLFGQSNYIKVFVEHPEFQDLEKEISKWLQEELDKIGLKSRSRDFIEEALAKRVCWLQLRPVNLVKDKNKRLQIEFDVLDWFDVWFDTKARKVMDTDFFVKKRKKLYQLKSHPDIYDNLEGLERMSEDDNDQSLVKDAYSATHSSTDSLPKYSEYEDQNNVTDEVELLEYYGVYDFSDGNVQDPDYKSDIKEVIFTYANRKRLIRIEENDIPTKRKRLMFPIRPMRQANSLIGKGIPQLIRDLAHENNDIRSLRMQNMKSLIKLLFKVDRNAGVDLKECFNSGGNSITYDGVMNKDGIGIFDQPNLIREATMMVGEGTQEMQQATGAVDYVMGTSAGRGVAETASGTRTITEQAMFKFSMMADNVYDDLVDCINFVAILFIINAKEEIEIRHPKLITFTQLLPEDLEESYIFDIEMRDLSQRRDLERSQWANMMGIIGPMVQQTGGNMQELLKQFMNIFQIPNQDKILQPEAPQAVAAKLMQNPQLNQAVHEILAAAMKAEQEKKGGKGGGGGTQTPAVPLGGDEVERAGNENLSTG